jgi:hypothetical protein
MFACIDEFLLLLVLLQAVASAVAAPARQSRRS